LILNLLDWARLQSDDFPYTAVKIDLKNLIEENINLVEAQLLNKNLSIELNLDTSKDYYVNADIHMINAIIRNLISNAIKFTAKGVIQISLTAKLEAQIIEVIDSGVGMDRKQLDQLFQLDKSISSLGTNFEQGTGLGLILCKEFVEKNNGNISVSSKKGEGSKFTVRLPAY